MINTERFLAVMKGYGDTQSSLAEFLGVSRQNICQVLKGRQGFTPAHVQKISERYHLTDSEIVDIFIFPNRKTSAEKG